MIQILKLRSLEKDGKLKSYDQLFDPPLTAPSLFELFKNLDNYLKQIPEQERWNVFYTLANCTHEKRVFEKQKAIAFDIDGINQLRTGEYITTICGVLRIEKDKTIIVNSGNGLHFIVLIKSNIESDEFFKTRRLQYKAICNKINLALEKENLIGQADPAIFDARRILRLPGTENRKPNKPVKKAELISKGHMAQIQALDLEFLSGLTVVAKKEQLQPNTKLAADNKAVMHGCQFLINAARNPGALSEPEWYAALSITARLNNGKELSHKISSKHPGYSHAETEQKIEQALEASGPRTCQAIDQVWGGCKDCPSYGKVKSPIMLRSKEFIATKDTGFHTATWKADGSPGKHQPCYTDLVKYFESLHPYVNIGGSKITLVWDGKKYKEWPTAYLEHFANKHFDPAATNNMRAEFVGLMTTTHTRDVEWFDESTAGHINFKNGVLNIETGELSDHDPARGFRYCLDFDYDPEALCPNYEKMLEKVTRGQKDLAAILNEFAGYAIAGERYWIHKALVLVGDGANGKSTWISILRKIAGRSNTSNLRLTDLQQSEYNRQMLDGKLFNISEETSVRSLADSSIFKSLVGDGVLQVRKPYKEPYEFLNKAKLILTCNELPESFDNTYGFSRRLLIVPFEATFTSDDEDFDPKIDEKLDGELSGIFNLFYLAYKQVKENGEFSTSEKSKEKTSEYLLLNNNTARWSKWWLGLENGDDYESTCDLGENSGEAENGAESYQQGGSIMRESKFISNDELYTHYKQQTEAAGEKPVKRVTFFRLLLECTPQLRSKACIKKIDGKTKRGFKDVDIIEGGNLQPGESTPLFFN